MAKTRTPLFYRRTVGFMISNQILFLAFPGPRLALAQIEVLGTTDLSKAHTPKEIFACM
jgi:hypothetical protein